MSHGLGTSDATQITGPTGEGGTATLTVRGEADRAGPLVRDEEALAILRDIHITLHTMLELLLQALHG